MRSIKIIFVIAIVFASCKTKKRADALFVTLTADSTGLDFANNLTPTNEFNMFHYMYFYNGAGIGAADYNNDGLTDLFFASNQSDNKIFLNKGNLRFEDVTKAAGIPQDRGWSTGVAVVDVNNDGLTDIYVSRVGQYETLHSKNQLLICKGIKNDIPYYEDQAAQYGVDFSGFSTQATFFDYDGDGDLDLFLLNHSVHQNGTFAPRKNFLGTYHPLSGDRLYRNDGNAFSDVTKQSMINSSAISYGLGVAVSDIDLDGWPDMYVSNDFHENDYLYINKKNGTFSEEGEKRMMHTAQFSMGVDVADVTNDGYPEIITMDMLPSDPYILKRSLGEDEYDIFFHKVKEGYSYQYTRNSLQYNRKNGLFSEVGMYSNVFATDWSWAPLWMDYNNDGLKDLFVSNGIPKRMNDMDYVNYISNSEVQEKLRENRINEKDMKLVSHFPQIKILNKFFTNKSNLDFTDEEPAIEGNLPSYSNGAVYADFDNDGDLDIVVNNIDEKVFLYRNVSNDNGSKAYVNIKLKGSSNNINAIGAKIVLFANDSVRTYENFASRGFMSSMLGPVHIGLYKTKVDSAFLIWPDNSFQKIDLTKAKGQVSFEYKTGLPSFNYSMITGRGAFKSEAFEDITAAVRMDYVHEENRFQEFTREPLIPHMLSTEGPAMAVADINHDGRDDVFMGASKTFHNAVYLQNANGTFTKTMQTDMLQDSMYEDADAHWVDLNNDSHLDLVIASGGNEYYGTDVHLLPRLYLNNGKGELQKSPDAFKDMFFTFSRVEPNDFNGDGYTDLFFAGRAVPWAYGETPRSYLLLNDKHGKFIDVTSSYSPELVSPGLVTDALWFDIDKNGTKDLLLCSEWGTVDAYLNKNGKFSKKVLCDKKGWWNFILPVDVNGDGNTDIVAGNLGLNTRLKASDAWPLRLYYNDFDDNGKKEQVLTYYLNGKEIPFANKDELQKQIPLIKKQFLYAEDFAKAQLSDIFKAEKLESSKVLTANFLSNAVLINNGQLNFTAQALPWQAQLTAYTTGIVTDANHDGRPDILLAGNYYSNNIQMGRYDADYGTLLLNNGKGVLTTETIHPIALKGQVRSMQNIRIKNAPAIILAMNNDTTRIIRYQQKITTSPGKRSE